MSGLTRTDQSLLWLVIGVALFGLFLALAMAFGIRSANHSLVECEVARVQGYIQDTDGRQIEVKDLTPPCRVNWP